MNVEHTAFPSSLTAADDCGKAYHRSSLHPKACGRARMRFSLSNFPHDGEHFAVSRTIISKSRDNITAPCSAARTLRIPRCCSWCYKRFTALDPSSAESMPGLPAWGAIVSKTPGRLRTILFSQCIQCGDPRTIWYCYGNLYTQASRTVCLRFVRIHAQAYH